MGLQRGLDHPEIFKALILVGCSSMPGDRYQGSRIDGYTKRCLEDPAAFDGMVLRFLERNGFVQRTASAPASG